MSFHIYHKKKIIEYIKNSKHLFTESITFPDALVYCGITPVIGNIQDIEKYYNNYKEIGIKIFIYDKNLLFIISNSLKKCKDIEDVLKANLLILDNKSKKNNIYHKMKFVF